MRITAGEVKGNADMQVIKKALEAAYTFITQPQRITGDTATYDVRDYNRLTTQLRQALHLATGGKYYGLD